jgi:hypothetical protein
LGGGEGRGEGRETVHPRKIHYIFSDDDTSDLLTNSLIHSLTPLPPSSTSSPGASRELSSSQPQSSSSSSATFRNPLKGKDKKEKEKEKAKAEKREKAREERVIIVDINENGDGVKSASSLSKDWQVLSASVSSAPTFDSSSQDQDPQNQNMQERGLMLRIEGVGVSALTTDQLLEEEKRDSGVLGEEEMSQLLEGFDRKMGVLRRIISARASREELEGGGDGALDDGGDLGAGGDGTAEVQGRRESEGGEIGSG